MRSDCFTCSLHGALIGAGASPQDLAALHVPVDDLIFAAGSTIYNMTDRATAIYCVRRGVVKLVRYDVDGNQRIVRILKENDLVAMECVFAGDHQHSAIAVIETRLCRIPLLQFRQIIAKHPPLQLRLLEKSLHALRDADFWLSELVSNAVPARVRLARLLLQLRAAESDQIHRLSLADFAGILGIASETVCRNLNELMDDEVLVKIGRGPNGKRFRADMTALLQISRECAGANGARKQA